MTVFVHNYINPMYDIFFPFILRLSVEGFFFGRTEFMKKTLQDLLDEPLKKKGGTQKMKRQMGIRNSYEKSRNI